MHASIQGRHRHHRRRDPGKIDCRSGQNESIFRAPAAVSTIVVCGMHSEFCVDTTTRRALALGYPVILVADAHTSAGNQAITAESVIAHHNITLTSISSFGPRAVGVLARDFGIPVTR